MSNVGRKTGKFKIITISAVAVAAVLLAVFFLQAAGYEKTYPTEKNGDSANGNLPFENIKIEYTQGDRMSFSAKLQREAMKSFLQEKGVDIPFVFAFLPEKLEVLGDAKINLFSADGYISLNLLEMNVNGFRISQKLLSDIGEIKLDFKRALVYN